MSLKTLLPLRIVLQRSSWVNVGFPCNNRVVQFCSNFEELSETKKKTKKPPEVRINLFTKNRDMTVVSLEEAERIAKRRGVLLMKIENPAKYMNVGNREAYELKQPNNIAVSKRKQFIKDGTKGLKQMQISSNIAQHDFDVKLTKINNWLENGYATEVTFLSPKANLDVEATLRKLESTLCNAKIPGDIKSKSSTLLRVLYEPSKKEANDSTSL